MQRTLYTLCSGLCPALRTSCVLHSSYITSGCPFSIFHFYAPSLCQRWSINPPFLISIIYDVSNQWHECHFVKVVISRKKKYVLLVMDKYACLIIALVLDLYIMQFFKSMFPRYLGCLINIEYIFRFTFRVKLVFTFLIS